MVEEWRQVVGLEASFEVSNMGRLRSLSSKWPNPPIRKLAYSPRGYARLTYKTANGRSKVLLVHRAVAKAFIPNPHNKPCVNHLDSNPRNNAVSNLEWATYSENTKYSFEKGLRVPLRGERNGNSLLTDIDVINMWHCRGAMTARELGALFGVKDQAVFDVWHRRRWIHLSLGG